MRDDPLVLSKKSDRRQVLVPTVLSLAVIGGLVIGSSTGSSARSEEAAAVHGSVVDEDGRVLRLISVTVDSVNGGQWSTVSDDSGNFDVADVDAGVQVTVSFHDDKWHQYDDADNATVLTLIPGEQRELGAVELDDGMNSRRSPRSLDVTDRSAVTTSWKQVLVPAVRSATSPRIRGCQVAPQSKRVLKKVSAAINWYRSMAGLDPVALGSRLNRLAQRSSVIQNYLRTGEYLSHDPPRSTRCWSKAGARAAGRSNLASGVTGAEAVSVYMSDFGVPSVGHRMWVLNPTASRFGSGDAGHYNSLYVIGPTNPKASQPPWVTWPSAGYFPYRETPETWSLRTSRRDVDLRRARVTLKSSTGQRIRALHPTRARDTLLWRMSAVPKVGNRPTRVRVSISGIAWRGLTEPPLVYTVHIVK